MAYEAETIAYSQKIFYYLLCHGALSDLDEEQMSCIVLMWSMKRL